MNALHTTRSIKSQVALLTSTMNQRKISMMKKVNHPIEQQLQHHRCLLASEVVHLMCLVPMFFNNLLESEKGINNTKDKMIVTSIALVLSFYILAATLAHTVYMYFHNNRGN